MILVSVSVVLFLATTAYGELEPVAEVAGKALAGFEESIPSWRAIYEDLHAHPEVSLEEVRTAAFLASKMREIGFEVTEKVGEQVSSRF